MWKFSILAILIIILSACNLSAPATVTPSATQTATLTATSPATTQATETATSTMTATHTATASNTPTVTFTPSITPIASITPASEVVFRVDRLEIVDIPDFLRIGFDTPLVMFANSNNQTTITNAATGEAQNTQQIIYLTSVGSQQRTPILELQTAEDNRFYPAESGTALAYFVSGANPGLYLLNVQAVSDTTFSARLWQTTTLVQRGILSDPVWTSDGEGLAVTQQTA